MANTNTMRFSSVSAIAADAVISGCPERHPRSKSLTEDGCGSKSESYQLYTHTNRQHSRQERMYIVEQHLTGF
jgi:hypothetical protein